MTFKYFTEDQKRRTAAESTSSVNGIDFLEIDSKKPAELRIHLFRAPLVPLALQNVEIPGGPGSAPVTVKSVLPEGGDAAQFIVTLTAAGDASTYRLNLIRSPSEPIAPVTFDPLLSSVEFSFQPEAARETDCAASPAPPASTVPLPQIDYLAKDFNSFRQLMLDRLSAVAPQWTERNLADLGMVLVEILAHTADQLSYHQDAVATEAYLGTARKRISVRRHARLLDYFVHEGCNARTWVCLEVSQAGTIKKSDAVFLTRCAEKTVIDRADLGALLEQHRPVAFEPLHDATLNPAHNPIAFYTFGVSPQCLPRGATRATLDAGKGLSPDGGKTVTLKAGDVLLFEEIRSPVTGSPLDADPSRRHAVRLTRVTAYTDPAANNRPIADIAWDIEDALPFSLCLCDDKNQEISVARGNVVLVDQGLTVQDESLDPPSVPRNGPYRPRLRRRGLTHAAPLDGLSPAAGVLLQDPQAALPAIRKITQKDQSEWQVRRDLLQSTPTAREVVPEIDDEGVVHLRFGDGVLGAKPAPDVEFFATYRIGNGQAGNAGADGIAHVVTSTLGITAVRNPLAAVGGVDPEPIEHVRLAAPRSFRTQERAVTEQDYIAAAERFPGVRKAAAFRQYTGSFSTHFIAVDRTGGAPVDDDFKSRLLAFLERFRLNGTELIIVPPVPVPIEISLLVHVEPGHLRSTLRASLAAAFSTAVLADGRRGFFHPDHFSFGQPVFLGQVVSTIMQVPGVASVDTTDKRNRFRRAKVTNDELREGKIAIGPLEIASSGTIAFQFEGGL